MFNLIITIIAIALVTVLAATSLFYAGDVLRGGGSINLVNQFLFQGEQIQGAIAYRNVNNLDYISRIEDLSSEKRTDNEFLLPAKIEIEGNSWKEPDENGMSTISNIILTKKQCDRINSKAGIKEAPVELPSSGVFGCYYQTELDGGIPYYKIGAL